MKGLINDLKQQKVYIPEITVYFCGMIFSCLLIIYTYTQPWAFRRTPDGIGMAPFPVFFLALIFITSALCFIESSKNLKAGKELTKGDLENVAISAMVACCVVCVVYTFFIARVDPLVLNAIFGAALLFAGGIRKWYAIAAVGLGIALFLYVFLIRIAGVWFPVSWFGF